MPASSTMCAPASARRCGVLGRSGRHASPRTSSGRARCCRPVTAAVAAHVAYELRRTYAVHQRLASLFGLTTIPDARALARAVATTLPLHLRLAVRERKGRLSAVARGAGLAVALPLGQYLGARSEREGRELLTVRGV